MKFKFLIIIFFSVLYLQGCILFSPELKTLKEVGESQKKIDLYLVRQNELFEKLVDDLKKEQLAAGTLKSEFIDVYGEPVLAERSPDSSSGEIMLYRHPTEYFNSDKVYVHFDQEGRLIHWEYIPVNQ